LLGAAVGSAVLVGALVVGDSVRHSLKRFALLRLGKVDVALSSGDRFFRAELLSSRTNSLDNVGVTALQLPATASADGGARRANRVQLLGVDERFWNLADQPPVFEFPAQDSVVLNAALAQQLAAKPGDSILLRVLKPSRLSREAPISPQEDSDVALRVAVQAVASDEEFGRFSLQASQAPPFNAFVPLRWLQEELKLPGRANLVLMVMDQNPWARPTATAALRRAWDLADAELELREIPEANALELRTSRVFLDAPITDAALKTTANATGVLTYFVNELRVGERTTPYSMVSALGEPIVPRDMRDDEILINQWLAEDLQAKPGDELALSYYIVGIMRQMEERTSRFRIRAIVPMFMPYADRSLMPDFPGMVEAKNCRDWDTGFPITLDKMRQKDNTYWEDHQGTPKAFVTLAAGQRMWTNRFGNLTAVRFPLNETGTKPGNEITQPEPVTASSTPHPALSPRGEGRGIEGEGSQSSRLLKASSLVQTPDLVQLRARIRDAILEKLDPAAIGFNFEPVRKQALDAVAQAQDFGQLFLGFSFFLIVAALLLMGLLFQFGIEQRTIEVGTLLALGFTPRKVRRLLLCEGGGLALVGGMLGTIGGCVYAWAMLRGLATIWRDASGTSALRFHAEPLSLSIGGFAGALVAWLTIWLVLRKQAQQPARELLAGGGDLSSQTTPRETSPYPVEHPVSPHPGPLPQGEGKRQPAFGRVEEVGLVGPQKSILTSHEPAPHPSSGPPLPLRGGEGMGEGESSVIPPPAVSLPEAPLCPHAVHPNRGLRLGIGGVVLSSVILGAAAFLEEKTGVGAFFGAGALLLISGLAFASAYLSALPHSGSASRPTLAGMGIRNATRRRKRSLATIGLLASGSFMIIAVGVFRLDSEADAQRRASGTGGFALIGESTAPVFHDLNSDEGREFFGLNASDVAGAAIVPLRVRDGEDASCLNLNRAQKPRLLGVQPELLDERNAFTFAAVAKGLPTDHPWLLLNQRGEDAIPAIADQASIQWALGKKVGDTLDYTDERGRVFQIRLVASVANSILQGNLLIAEDEFRARFTHEQGYRMFLIDAPSNEVDKISSALSRALQDMGLELTPAARRLAAFNAVQNTYLNTFQVLGGLGLLLGSVGLGVVVLRNVFERRGELALLLAVGFRPRVLRWLVLSEHGALLLAGLGVGVLAAAVAVAPALLSAAADVPIRSLSLVLSGVLLSGAMWAWLAALLALRGRLLDALRME
jgi:ABC-type antimicrobial peptide transport system permease subunit